MKVKQFFIRLNKEDRLQDEEIMNIFMSNIEIQQVIPQIVSTEKISYWSVLLFYEEISSKDLRIHSKNETLYNFKLNNLTTEEKNRFDALRIWRSETARLKHYPNFIISSNLVLIDIAIQNPHSIETLSNIKGFGENKVRNYGEEILLVLNSI